MLKVLISTKTTLNKMLNLLQSNMCGGNSTNSATVNDSHYLSRNLQRSGDLRTEQFEESIKIEQITSGDGIAYIKIRDDVGSATSVKSELHNRTQFQRKFLHKYPAFLRHYCMCLHRKIEPSDDLNSVSCLTEDKYGANGFLLNRTPIIPITAYPTKYVIFQKKNSPQI